MSVHSFTCVQVQSTANSNIATPKKERVKVQNFDDVGMLSAFTERGYSMKNQ